MRRACRSLRKARYLPLSKLPRCGCSSSARSCGTSAWTTHPLSWLVRRSSSLPWTSLHAPESVNPYWTPAPTSSLSNFAGRRDLHGARGQRRRVRPPRPGRRAHLRLRGAPHHCVRQVRAPTNRLPCFPCFPVLFLEVLFRYPGTLTTSSLSSTTITSPCTSSGPLH